MNARANFLFTRLLALLLAMTFSLAPTNNAMAQDGPAFTQQELDQMLAPIALYPDSLLSQIMMAATYPLEVVEADRWSRANSDLRGERAVRAVERNNWDPSVKSLVAFPQILGMMSDKLDWTERLGDAFLDQEAQVMDTVQDLRQRAYTAGNLRSNDWYRVNPQGSYISIEQANMDMAYLPYYNPNLIYGPWWWSQYPPVYWSSWPGYYERPGFGAGFAWGAGITLGTGFYFGAFDWQQRRVNVVNVNNNYYPRNAGVANRASNTWQHDPDHRRGTPYRAATVREKFSRANAAPEARRDYRGNAPANPEQRGGNGNRPYARDGRAGGAEDRGGARPIVVAPPSRPDAREGRAEDRTNSRPTDVAPAPRPDSRDGRTGGNEDRSNTKPAVVAPATRPDARDGRTRGAEDRMNTKPAEVAPATRPGAPVASRPNVVAPPALEGIGRGTEARDASARGRASRAAPENNVPAPRPPANVAAPRPPERVAAPPPQPAAAPAPPARAAAPTPSPPAAATRPPEKARDNRKKGPDEK
jgi:hypothetical protein